MTNPKVTIPGSQSDTVPASYVYQPFPKCVYGKDLDDVKVITSQDEWPDGYREYDEVVAELRGEKPAKKTTKAAAAKTTKAAAAKAEEALRVGIMEYLDEHNVDYAKDISTSDLEDLKVKLDNHLAAQETKDDAE